MVLFRVLPLILHGESPRQLAHYLHSSLLARTPTHSLDYISGSIHLHFTKLLYHKYSVHCNQSHAASISRARTCCTLHDHEAGKSPSH
jgi:hypothetical protein